MTNGGLVNHTIHNDPRIIEMKDVHLKFPRPADQESDNASLTVSSESTPFRHLHRGRQAHGIIVVVNLQDIHTRSAKRSQLKNRKEDAADSYSVPCLWRRIG